VCNCPEDLKEALPEIPPDGTVSRTLHSDHRARAILFGFGFAPCRQR
jgi:hypothetical protein